MKSVTRGGLKVKERTVLCVCFSRALEMLQEINKSVNRRSSHSNLALINLVKTNLSVKYSLTGQLASTDIIVDGFYDTGKVCAPLQVMFCGNHLNQYLI